MHCYKYIINFILLSKISKELETMLQLIKSSLKIYLVFFLILTKKFLILEK